MMMSDFYKQGLSFSCTRCSQCCRGESGYVFLSKDDLVRLSLELKMDEADFLLKFCKIVDLGIVKRVSLVEKVNNDCIFWDSDGCTVYGARPLQCQNYPFWPHLMEKEQWEKEKMSCPGINNSARLHSASEIDQKIKLRDNNPLIELK